MLAVLPKPPTQWLDDILTGRIPWDDAPASVQSWARLFIHQAAVDVLKCKSKETRRAALDKMPDFVRPRIEAEALRVFEYEKAR